MSVLDTDFPWNPEQEEIIQHQDGPLQVIACAGSGKTSTVSARIAELVHNGVDRESILAFTFTENAAEELKVRIRDWMHRADLGDDHLGDMYVDTIHAFCQDLLNEYRPNTLSYDVLSETELAAFLSQHYWEIGLDELPPGHPEARYEKIEWFKEDIDTVRRELRVDDLQDSDEDHAPQLCKCYDNYRELMERFHFFDYQELIYRAVQLLEDDLEVLEDVQEQYQYIIVDEYQDVNPAQQRLIQLLAGDNRNLCVVGDDDQSIYNWRGARPEEFRNFADDYGADREILAENFRSTDLVVDLSQSLIENNSNRIDKPMETDRSHDVGDVYQHYFDDEREEIGWIADRIEELIGVVYEDPKGNEKTLRYGDIGILFRRRQDIENVQNELEAREIPYTIRGPNNIFDHPVAGFVRLALAYVARGQEDDPDARYDSVEIIDAHQSDPRDTDDITRYAVTEQDLRQAIRRSRHLQDREEEIIERLNEIQDWYRNPTSRRIEPQSELHKILNAMGIHELPDDDEDLSSDAFPEPVMYNIGKISELIQDFETVYEIIFPDQIRELVDFLDYAYFFSNPKVDDPTRINAVELMTVHSSKGMEFPAVFMPNLTRLKFSDSPNAPRSFRRHQEWIPQDVFNYDQYQDGPEELRRLFYVGMTRSQKFLHLTGSENNIGYSQIQNPSPFFEEVDQVGHSDVMTELLPDPTPREYREIDATPREYNFPTSFTDLRYYRKCPYDYKLRKIYGFAPPIDQAFGYGFAVHDLLREMHERHDVEHQDQLMMSPGEIRNRTQDEDRFHLRYASGEIEENLRDSAAEMLIEYSQEYQDDLISAFKAEVPFELLLSGDDDRTALVTGEIDLLERRDPETDELVEVDVIDFKTSDEPEDDNQKLLDHRFQVRLYGLATQKELDPRGAEGYIHYLTENSRIDVDLSDEKVEQVENWITNMVDGIMSREFYATPEPDICDGCDFEGICPHAETN